MDEASHVVLPSQADVCIVGGGAAGLVAAITAAEQGAQVIVIERGLSCGRTILATGNGRCNFANTHLASSLYHNSAFVRATTGSTWLEDILAFFETSGLAWEEEDEGRLYPLSRQAASVRNVLLERARRAGVTYATAREVRNLRRTPNGFELIHHIVDTTDVLTIACRRVVIATGGGTSLGHELGLDTRALLPILCPLACTHPLLSALDGRRVRSRVTLLRNGDALESEVGEVLFRDYGLSGIVVFNLSRHTHPGDEVELDLLPSIDASVAKQLACHTLDGLLDPVVAHALHDHAKSDVAAIELAKRLLLRVDGPAETDRAQVTRGGLATDAFDPSTLEAHAVPGLFACGEALDVDGPCGGYNLAWAWKSGMVAGSAAARRLP